MIGTSELARDFWENGRSEACPIYDMHGHMGTMLRFISRAPLLPIWYGPWTKLASGCWLFAPCRARISGRGQPPEYRGRAPVSGQVARILHGEPQLSGESERGHGDI